MTLLARSSITGGADVADVAPRNLSANSAVLGALSAAGYHPILQSFPHGAIIVFDRDLRYLSAGGLGLADVGLSREVLEGQTIFDVFPGEVTSVIEPLYRAALAGSESEVDVPFHGRIFLQRLGPVRDEGGAIVAGMGFTQDVTESRRVQQSLREAQNRLRAVVEQAPIGLAIVSLTGHFEEVNPAFCQMTGYRDNQLLRMTVADFADPADRDADRMVMDRLLAGEVSSYASDTRFRAVDGSTGWVARSASLLRSVDGSPMRFIFQIKEIGDRKQADLALLDKTRQLQNTEMIGQSGSWALDLATGAVTWSDGLFAVYGIDRAAFGGNNAAADQMTHPQDRARIRAAFDACVEVGTPYKIRYRLTRPRDGALRWCEARVERLYENGQPSRIGGSVIDVTDLVLAQNEIQTAYLFQQAIIDASPDLVFAYRLAARSVVWSNRSLAAMLGFSAVECGEPQGVGADRASPPHADRDFDAPLLAALDTVGQDAAHMTVRVQDATGDHRWFSLRTTPLHRDDRGVVVELLGVLRDVSDAVVAQKHLEHIALHDSLTGLPNRALLVDRIDGALIRSDRDRREISVLFCDLDGFKHINDTAGHAAGDAVLVETARRLQQVLREGDTVARIGGDEFVMLVEPWNRRSADNTAATLSKDEVAAQDRQLAPRIAARIAAALREPVVVKGVEHVVTASIGITYGTISTVGNLRTATAEDMLQDADAAMYKAKSRGKDRFEVFEQTMRATAQERGRVERILRQVLHGPAGTDGAVPTGGDTPQRSGALTAAYQPIFDSTTSKLVGFEALARLVDADGVNVPPDVFIGIAEEVGLIRRVGLVILDLACAQLASWRNHNPGMAGVTMAVNVSALQAAHSTLGDDVRRALATHVLQPDDLILELTETALLHAAHSTIVNLRALHDEGVGIAIDDFGVGYASLRYLATMPVSALKIDRSFTAGLPDDTVSRKIVMAVAGLAADLELTCVVEGVETVNQLQALPAGVQLQGYLTGRPQEPAMIDLENLLINGAVSPGSANATPNTHRRCSTR